MFIIYFLLLLLAAIDAAMIPTSVNVKTENITVHEPDPNCPMVGFDCLFNDIERAANVGQDTVAVKCAAVFYVLVDRSWQECAAQCAGHRLCAYWSWRVPSALVNPYGCWLKSACPLTIHDDWLISGSYTCTSQIFTDQQYR